MTHGHTDKQREHDEWVCRGCGKRWDVNEDAPRCSPEPKLIGLCGAAGSGKTTAAHHLRDEHGFMHLKFADTLKDMLRTMLYDMDIDEDQVEEMIEGSLKEEKFDFLNGKSTRELMQTLGTNWARNHIGPDLWVMVMSSRIKAVRRDDPYVDIVIDDVRFDNEACLISDLGGDLVRIAGRSVNVNNHPSEFGVGLWDVTYANTGTVDDFKSWVTNYCDVT